MDRPKYRTLWTWDMCTGWDDSVWGRSKGSSGVSFRRHAFLRDYKRLVDYASAHHLNGVIIWGAVRAHDDGFEQLKELVKYGREKGVTIMPGVSAFGYGGVCYDPRKDFPGATAPDMAMENHPYSLSSWLRKHPDYAAIDANGKPYPYGPLNVIACPSRKENIEWFKEGLNWLYEEFDIDGLQVEIGDYGICHCPLCEERRKGTTEGKWYSIADMLSTYTEAINISKAHKKEPWVVCETYSSVAVAKDGANEWKSMSPSDREILAKLPEGGILQWSADRAVGPNATHVWREGMHIPSDNNILRLHTGSQWAQVKGADWGTNLVFDMAKKARTFGINGVSIFGEESPFAPPNEANYLALEEAAGFGKDNPEISEELFYSQTLDPLYGGSGLAKRWRELYTKSNILGMGSDLSDPRLHINTYNKLEDLTDEPEIFKRAATMSDDDKVKEIEKYYNEARSISAKFSGEVCGRWTWLENHLWKMRHVCKTKIVEYR